jgi:hypothetical protein
MLHRRHKNRFKSADHKRILAGSSMTPTVTNQDVERIYRAAAIGLGFSVGRTPQRFGYDDSHARWEALRGGLQDWHRVDILVRGTAVRNPAGFRALGGVRVSAVAEDEPCGPDYPGPAPTQAAEFLLSSPGPRKREAAREPGMRPLEHHVRD